jgi:hypothetical protein
VARGEVKRQIGVALSDDFRDRLEKAAEAAGHSIGEEIRQRLEQTFVQERIDPVTRELIEGILNIAELVAVDLGYPWHAGSGAHSALSAAIAQRIDGYKPQGGDPRRVVSEIFGHGISGEDAEAAGRTHERHDRRSHTYQHLQAAQDAQAKAARSRLARAARHMRKKDGNDE